MMEVYWTGPAKRDLLRIVQRIQRDNPDAARRVAERIFQAGLALGDFPLMGRLGRVEGTHEWVFPGWPYLLVYEVKAEKINVLRVIHGAQDWP